ncbi:histidine kinase N-terminal 7TM domain-containing protein [Methanospirillum lacunae]|uniref:histidine kinase n=1 Tax=Methanospirillum lacunae TaxID=668570 RepID=A0A2V2NEL8_9EURY|nr:histidine kinase N-terminal 7TM domain-containing protein [Methanospirillum lacunae]PWR73763.1 histidine kinase [Methanospirillum lacunae]
MDLFSILVWFCLVSACITYGLGFFVLSKNSSSPVNRLFFAVMLGASYWAVGEFLIWHVNSYEGSWFWLKASSFWTLVIATTVHFSLTFTSHWLSKREHILKIILLIYLPSLFFAALGICTNSTYIMLHAGTGYQYSPVYGSVAFQIESIYFLFLMLSALYFCVQSWIRSHKERVRRQCALVSTGFLLIIGLGSQSAFYLPRNGIILPNLVFIGIVLFSFIIAYTILRYGLFTLGPEAVASNIISTMPDGLVLTDMNGLIISGNSASAKLFRLKPGHMEGLHVTSCISVDEFSRITQLVSESGTLSDYECNLKGSEVPVSIASSLVRDPEGDPAGIILILRDITARKSAERALEIANEKVTLLSRLTRHDLSNLVTSLLGYLTLIREDGRATIDNPHFIACIDLAEKISQHLQFSHEYHMVGSHDPVWIHLPHAIQAASHDLATGSVQISMNLPEVMIYADPLFRKVIYNLFENAIRHGNSITGILISSLQSKNGDLELFIEDDGDGIREDEKELIFYHGYGKNSGLGLTMVREILSVTGISITETGIFGQGARFKLIIPSDYWKTDKPD